MSVDVDRAISPGSAPDHLADTLGDGLSAYARDQLRRSVPAGASLTEDDVRSVLAGFASLPLAAIDGLAAGGGRQRAAASSTPFRSRTARRQTVLVAGVGVACGTALIAVGWGDVGAMLTGAVIVVVPVAVWRLTSPSRRQTATGGEAGDRVVDVDVETAPVDPGKAAAGD